MYAIASTESWQVVAFNRDNTQQRLCSAHSLAQLLKEYTKHLEKAEKAQIHKEVMKSYKIIKVWNVDQGFTGLELPYIQD